MKHYYCAGEARQQLGINVGAFYYLIDTGKIKKLTPPGKKQGFYSKHQIERLARERLKCMSDEEEPGTTFRKAIVDDIQEEYELAVLMLNGGAGYDIPTLRHLGRSKSLRFTAATTNCARRSLSSVTCAPDTATRRVCRPARRAQQCAFNLRNFSALQKRFCNGAPGK